MFSSSLIDINAFSLIDFLFSKTFLIEFKGINSSENYEVMIKYELYKALGMYLYNMHIYVNYIDINLTWKDSKARFTTVPLKALY